MLTHADVWRAIDRLAERHGLSTSGLARKAGLDPTTFNKSKRATADGRLRWPSTESISKVLEATGSSLAELVGLTEGTGPIRRLPLLHLASIGPDDPFSQAGDPAGPAWDETEFPQLDDPRAFAVEIAGDAQLPVYRDGDVVVVTPTAPPRRNDRIVLRTRAGDLVFGTLTRQTATRVELTPFAPNADTVGFEREEMAWMARIRWACQ